MHVRRLWAWHHRRGRSGRRGRRDDDRRGRRDDDLVLFFRHHSWSGRGRLDNLVLVVHHNLRLWRVREHGHHVIDLDLIDLDLVDHHHRIDLHDPSLNRRMAC